MVSPCELKLQERAFVSCIDCRLILPTFLLLTPLFQLDTSMKRPGMLASIAESLVEAGLSVESVTTELQRHGSTDRSDFVVNADCVTTSYMDKEHIHGMVRDLESLKKTLELDVVDIRVQRLVTDRE